MNDINERIAKVKEQIIETKIFRHHFGLTDYDDIIDNFEVFITTIESQNSQIESLKAITELAVKGLGLISKTSEHAMTRAFATNKLSEIERLQNAPT